MAADEQDMNKPATATVGKSKTAGRKRRTRHRASRKSRAAARTQPAQERSFARGYGRKAAGLVRRGKRLVDDAFGGIDDARGAVARIAGNMHLPSVRGIESFAGANPVLLGAVGLGIGVILGALLPRDTFHAGMQGLGFGGASPPVSPRSRKTTKQRARK
jgi:hypothetical protein